VEEVRNLQDFINLTGTARRQDHRVLSCRDAGIRTLHALLKNLEEPPPGTRFMLIAHRPSYLPATIISRCNR